MCYVYHQGNERQENIAHIFARNAVDKCALIRKNYCFGISDGTILIQLHTRSGVLKTAVLRTRADRQAVQRRTPVPVRLAFCFVPSVVYRECLNSVAQTCRSFIQVNAMAQLK